tara:strand:+ start:80 stop:430 length:351 start_codon:yes stop_codon:yes gene_type:complete
MFSNEKEILMYYHSSTRNVGLFTSVAVAMQAYASRTENQNILKSFVIYAVHIFFLLMAIYINYLLIEDLQKSQKVYKIVIENRWININYATLSFLFVLLIFNSITLFKYGFKLFKK